MANLSTLRNTSGIVYTIGDQNISGIKNFISRPSVNGTGILLSGEAAQVDLSPYITTGQSGAFYSNNNPSGFITSQNVVFTTGNQTLSGVKTFDSHVMLNNDLYANGDLVGNYLYINGIFDQEDSSSLLEMHSGSIVLKPNYAGQTGYVSIEPRGTVNGIIPEVELRVKGGAYAYNLVYNTGNQDISGLKDFQTTPTVNDIPVLLSGNPVDLIHLYGKNDQGATIYKGQPVYIAGANGANPLIQLASNTGERTSSRTIGLLAQDLLVNEFGYVITEGTLEGFNTSAGVAGDPIWLGPTGSLLFGTGNKPYAPNHLVYLGVVLRSNQNNGKVYIRTQNGYEVDEFHNVAATSPQNRDTLLYNSVSGLWVSRQLTSSDLPSTVVYTTGDQTISGNKNFVNDVYIKNLFVTGTETIVSTTNFNVQSPYLILNLTGGANDGGIFFVTGSGLTGINDYGPIIGFDHSKNFKFGIARRSDDLSILNDIAAVQDITNYSGFVNGNFYPINNPSGFITGVDLSSYITNAQTGNFVTTSQTGAFYAASNPNGYITGLDTSNFYTKDNPSGFITGIENLVYTYGDQLIGGTKHFASNNTIFGAGPLNILFSEYTYNNELGFITSNDEVLAVRLSDGSFQYGGGLPGSAPLSFLNGVGNFNNRPTVDGTGVLLNGEAYGLNNPSGFITGIDLSSYVTASQTGEFYPLSNPSGYITGVDLSNYVTGSVVRPSETGNFITSNQTGAFYAASNPNGFITGVDLSNYVTKTLGQFSDRPTVNGTGILLSGEAGGVSIENVTFTTGDQTISGVKNFITVSESFLTLPITNQTVNIPLNSGMNFILPLTTGVTGIILSNPPSNLFSFTLRVDYSGAYAVVWPTGTPGRILWPEGAAPTLTSVSGKEDLFTFLTYNQGTDFFGIVSAQNF